jgi:hypothetical protein
MRCGACYGSGWQDKVIRTKSGYPIRRDRWTCQDCGGSGIAHCCDGLRACPDTPVDGSIGMEKEP